MCSIDSWGVNTGDGGRAFLKAIESLLLCKALDGSTEFQDIKLKREVAINNCKLYSKLIIL